MTPPGHEMIMASAGSGKTYALTNRFVRLLALGAAPERIVALTFTRKAAGEFFDEILHKLARGADDAAGAAALDDELNAGRHEPEDYRRWLRAMIDAMPRLALGTFDAFFARIVRSFPLELGLGGDFTLLEDYAAQFERRRVMRALFARAGGGTDDAQREFIEAFKRATFGREEKHLAPLLDQFIDEHHQDYLDAPDAALWGDPARIWPHGCTWLTSGDAEAAVRTLRAWVDAAPIGDPQRRRWLRFLEAFAAWSPGANPPRELLYVLEKALDAWTELNRGTAVLEFDRRKQDLSPAACTALQVIARTVFCGELARRLEITRGIHAVLARYDEAYDRLVRRAARLTFNDVERLLHGIALTTQPVTEAVQASAERRLLLDWRLDGQFDHWLLDEFQDTSRGQWGVLRNLIDEVVQDASQARTFFCVGDVKQAIYGWRGGDARLFREILDHYNSRAAEPVIRLEPMDQSWRSGPAVLELVNRVFGHARALAALSPAAGARWTQDWRDHTSARPHHTGQAAWLHAEDEDDCLRRTRELLLTIEPLARGLSAAVLTQTNERAARIADYLRRDAHLPAVAEADLHVCTDNPATSALLALFKAAAHPGDSLAWAHVLMSPLRDVLAATMPVTGDALTRRVLRQVHTEGFAATIEWWWRRLETHLDAADAFTHGRGRQLVEAARRFDDTGGRDIAEFLEFAERHVVRDTDSAGVIRVMTIHKAKGLGFDVVILPDLEGKKLARRRNGLAVHRGADHAIEWVLDLPPQFFRDHDPILGAHARGEEADECYEKIALLYVGLTRAKRAVYLVSTDGTTTESLNYPRLLATALGGITQTITVGRNTFPGGFSTGDPNWFTALAPAPPAPPPPPPATIAPDETHRVTRHVARTPSDQLTGRVSAAALLAPDHGRASEFGTAVHAALARVMWWDPGEAETWTHSLRQAGVPEDAITAARACLQAPALANVFRATASGASEVWCERSFEFVHEGLWITGRFDRVLLTRDPTGRVTRVRVIDFKTDRVGRDPAAWAEVAERYRPQVGWYRRAAALLAGVPEDRVTCEIVLTAARDAAGEVPAALVVR